MYAVRPRSLVPGPFLALLFTWAAACSTPASPTAPSTPTTPVTPPAATCVYTVADAGRTRTVDAAGGAFTLAVSTGAGCSWSASVGADFLSVAAGASGEGNGSVEVRVAANGGDARSGQVTVAGQSITVTQDGAPPPSPCVFVVTPETLDVPAEGGSFTATVEASGPSCPWTAAASEPFVTITSDPDGADGGTVTFDVGANPGRERTATLTVASRLITIRQAATTACATTVEAVPDHFVAGGGTGTLAVTAPDTCDWAAAASDTFVTFTGPVTGSGTGQVAFAVMANAGANSRTGTLGVSGRTTTITQDGAVAPDPDPPTPGPPGPLPSSPAPTESFFRFTSDHGDWVGRGGDRYETSSTASFSARSEGGGQQFSATIVAADGSSWDVTLVAPNGEALTAGLYEGATRASFQAPGDPGLSVSGAGRSCNTLTGRFAVYEVEPGATGTFRRFHAAFEQHCDGAPAGLVGEIAIVTSAPVLPPPTASPTSSALWFNSESGDYIGKGISWSYTPATSTFAVVASPSGSSIRIDVNGSTLGDWWTLAFVAPGGGPPGPGLYEGAVRWPFQTASEPGFSLHGNGRGCNTLTATFEVHDLVWDSGGAIERFQATFEQHCEGASPAARGEIIIVGNPPM